MTNCTFTNCSNQMLAKGLCNKHYKQKAAHGIVGFSLYAREQKIKKFWQSTALTADNSRCWLWQGITNNLGYGLASVGILPTGRLAHRISFYLTFEIDPKNLCVAHRCDNPLCVNPSHLFLATKAENSKDMVAKGRSTCGEKHPNRKLTAKKVTEIRHRLQNGDPATKLADEYGVTFRTISSIKLGKQWKEMETLNYQP